MRKVKGKYIRLTEGQLHQIIKDEVDKRIQTLIEYAIPRKNFVNKTYNLVQQIVENWCLIHYGTMVGGLSAQDHWRKELLTHMSNIANDTIKGNNSYESRVKAISEGFDMKDLPSSGERVRKLISAKLIIEVIDTNCDEIVACSEDCNNAIGGIIEMIAENNLEKMWEYIQTL